MPPQRRRNAARPRAAKPPAVAAKPDLVSNRDARRLELHLKALTLPPAAPLDGDGLHRLICRLGYVQLDSIRVIERAHDMILFARNRNYRADDLARLMQQERRLFEHCTHDAALIPMQFYPHWRHRFRREAEGRRGRQTASRSLAARAAHIMRRIEREGALMARDFRDPKRPQGADGWWEWGPSKRALDHLWRTGRLAVSGREGFQKRYDLAERVIPARLRLRETTSAESAAWKCAAALERLGAASAREIADFWGSMPAAEAKGWIGANLGKGLREVLVAGAGGRPPRLLAAREDIFERIASAQAAPATLRLISPFDPLVRERGRAAHLFGFDYRIEVFVPAAKRRYGYYVFPVLDGQRFIGRAEAVAKRKQGVLRLENLWLEPGVVLTASRRARLRAELVRLARFTGCAEAEIAALPKSATGA